MNENASKPIPPAVSEGCWACGEGTKEVLESRTIKGMSIALCKNHINVDPSVAIAKLSLQVTK